VLGLADLADLAAAEAIQVNDSGLVLKGPQSGKWQIIINLSFPPGRSINNGVNPGLCSLTYTSVDKASRTEKC